MGAPSLLSPALYLVATTLLLPGTTLLLGDARDQQHAIDFLVAACSLLVTAALVDLGTAITERRRAKSAAAAAAGGAGDLAASSSLTVSCNAIVHVTAQPRHAIARPPLTLFELQYSR